MITFNRKKLSLYIGLITLIYTSCTRVSEAQDTSSKTSILSSMIKDHNPVPASKEEIDKIMAFWNGLTYITCEITQFNQAQDTLITGKLWIKKDKKSKAQLRLDYEESVKQRILVKNGEVIIVDLEDGATSAYPSSMTPVELLLNPSLKLDKDVTLIKAVRYGNIIEFVLSPKGDTSATLTLFLKLTRHIQFLGWKIRDVQRIETEVILKPETLKLNDPAAVPQRLFE